MFEYTIEVLEEWIRDNEFNPAATERTKELYRAIKLLKESEGDQ